MAGTKISAGTANPTAALTDEFPIYSSGQGSSDKYVNTLTQVRNLFFNSTEEWEEFQAKIPHRGVHWETHFWETALVGFAGASASGGERIALSQTASGVQMGEARARLTTGSGAYGSDGYGTKFYLGQGKIVFETRVTSVQAGTLGYRLAYGISSNTSPAAGADQVDGCWIEYDSTVGANWLRVTSRASSRTRNASGYLTGSEVAYSLSASHILKIEINADASSVEFFVDGTSLGTETANIPLTTTTLLPFRSAYCSSWSSGSLSEYFDYMKTYCIFTTAKTS
jgi:hypothetical protein